MGFKKKTHITKYSSCITAALEPPCPQRVSPREGQPQLGASGWLLCGQLGAVASHTAALLEGLSVPAEEKGQCPPVPGLCVGATGERG